MSTPRTKLRSFVTVMFPGFALKSSFRVISLMSLLEIVSRPIVEFCLSIATASASTRPFLLVKVRALGKTLAQLRMTKQLSKTRSICYSRALP